jgi:hypothetical protein
MLALREIDKAGGASRRRRSIFFFHGKFEILRDLMSHCCVLDDGVEEKEDLDCGSWCILFVGTMYLGL